MIFNYIKLPIRLMRIQVQILSGMRVFLQYIILYAVPVQCVCLMGSHVVPGCTWSHVQP